MPELRIDPLSGLRVIVAGERGHVQRFVGLDHIDVVWEAATTNDHDVALRWDRNRVALEVIVTGSSVGQFPVSAVQPGGLALLVNDRVDTKSRRDHRGDPFTLFMHRIAIESTCAYPCLATASLKIQSKHVRGFDRLRRCKARTD